MAFLARTDMLIGVDADKAGIAVEFRICSLLHITAVKLLDKGAARAK